MKYLVYFKPSSDLLTSVEKYQKRFSPYITKIAGPEMHVTLMLLYMDSSDETAVVQTLERLVLQPFEIETENIDYLIKIR